MNLLTSSKRKKRFIESIQNHGDLLYDLCYSVLNEFEATKSTLHKIFKTLYKENQKYHYNEYAQDWVLCLAVRELLSYSKRLPHEKIELLSESTDHAKFDYYFYSLSIHDRILLILRDKFKLSYENISRILLKPAETIELKRVQLIHQLWEQVYSQSKSIFTTDKDDPTYQRLIIEISSQPKHLLPEDAKKNPLSRRWSRAIRTDEAKRSRRKWRYTPWYIRNTVEGIAISLTLFSLLFIIPKIKSYYDERTEEKLKLYFPDSVSNPLGQSNPNNTAALLTDTEEENSNETQEVLSDEHLIPEEKLNLTDGQIWRLYIKTESPREMRPKIIDILKAYDLGDDISKMRGVEAPGGIQFDLLIRIDEVQKLGKEIETLAKMSLAQNQTQSLSLAQAFTWYRNASKKYIPSGKTRVIIWLSQI